MDGDLPYLRKRASFHRRMARKAARAEARCAHDAFVRAYQARIDELTSGGLPAPSGTVHGSGQTRQRVRIPAYSG